MIDQLDIDHPWPGPDSFRTRDKSFFRGRDSEIKQLLQLIDRADAVVLYGASGLGKTSLINAGLVPRLREADKYFAVPIRISYVAGAPAVSEQIQTEIYRSRSGPGMPAPRPGRTAWELLHLSDEPIEGAQPLLIFDQFEELFTIGVGTPQAIQLVDELKALIEGAPPASVQDRLDRDLDEARLFSFERRDHRVLISIREDFLYGLEALRNEVPSIIHNRLRLGPLSGTKALEVVLQPPAAKPEAGAGEPASGAPLVAPDVAELIVRTVATSVPDDRPLELLEVEPALLSILCAELARRRSPGTPITRDLVTGNRAVIISSFYERCLQDVPGAVRAYIEDALVTATGFRTSTVVDEALAVPGFTGQVLSELINRRLVRVIERQKAKWLELTHDILTEIAARSRALRQDRLRAAQDEKARAEAERVRAARHRVVRNRMLIAAAGVLVAFAMLSSMQEVKRRAAIDSYTAATAAKHALRRQFIEASLREARYREALVQLAAAVDEEPNEVWARALVGDLVLRRGWALAASPVFPDGPFTWLVCNWTGSRCAAAYRDGRVLVRGDLARDLVTGETGYGDLFMSTDGGRLVFIPEKPGTATQWTFGPIGTEILSFPVEASWNTMDVSADARVVALPREAELVVWRLDGTATPVVIPRKIGNAQFALSPDGKWLAYVKDETSVELASLEGEPARTARVLAKAIVQLRIDPGSDVLVAALNDGTLLRWSIRDGQPLPRLQARRAALSIFFDWTGDEMALGLEGGGVELWKKPWDAAVELMPSSSGVMNVSFAPDDPWLAVATRDGTVSAWSFSGGSLGEPMRFDGLALAWAQERHGLLGVSLGGTSARWTIPIGHASRQYELSDRIQSAWFVSDDAFFAIGSNLVMEQTGDRSERSRRYRSGLSVSPDRSHSATAYVEGLYLRQGMPSRSAKDDADKLLVRVMMDDVMFSADGKRLVAAGGGKGYLFDVTTGEALGRPIDGVAQAWLNEDGTIIATKGNDVGLKLWQCASDGSLTKLAEVDTRVVSSVTFSRDSQTLVFASENQARVWSLRNRRFVGRAVAHDATIIDVGFSPDARWIVTASTDKRARIWEAASGLPASDWFEHGDTVTAASFSPSGRKLLTASADGFVRVWDLANTGDAADPERRWLARLAEILSGMRIDPETDEAVPAPAAFEALESLRGEIKQACPGALTDPPACASATTSLIRAVIDTSDDRPAVGPVKTASAR